MQQGFRGVPPYPIIELFNSWNAMPRAATKTIERSLHIATTKDLMRMNISIYIYGGRDMGRGLNGLGT